jgi:hypothetical protein
MTSLGFGVEGQRFRVQMEQKMARPLPVSTSEPMKVKRNPRFESEILNPKHQTLNLLFESEILNPKH